jgi:16S rRNA processing protein RimM
VGGGRLAIKLDREAERGAVLGIPRSTLPALAPDEYYLFELVGLDAVCDDGTSLGRVAAVLPGTANDNLELDNGTLVPMIEDAVRDVDLDKGRILLNCDFIS